MKRIVAAGAARVFALAILMIVGAIKGLGVFGNSGAVSDASLAALLSDAGL